MYVYIKLAKPRSYRWPFRYVNDRVIAIQRKKHSDIQNHGHEDVAEQEVQQDWEDDSFEDQDSHGQWVGQRERGTRGTS